MIAIPIVFFYLFMMGLLQPKFKNYYYNGTPNMSRSDSSFCAALSSLVFPLMLPIGLGVMASRATFSLSGIQESKHQREIIKARHRTELARIRAEETEALERSAFK